MARYDMWLIELFYSKIRLIVTTIILLLFLKFTNPHLTLTPANPHYSSLNVGLKVNHYHLNNILLLTFAIQFTFSNNTGHLVQVSQDQEVSAMPHKLHMEVHQSNPLFLAVLSPQLQLQAPLELLLAVLKTW